MKIWFQNRRTKWKKLDNISNALAAEHKVHGKSSSSGSSSGGRDRDKPVRKSKGSKAKGLSGDSKLKPINMTTTSNVRIPEYTTSLDSYEDHSNGSVLTHEGALSESTTSEYGSKASSPPADDIVHFYHTNHHFNPLPLAVGFAAAAATKVPRFETEGSTNKPSPEMNDIPRLPSHEIHEPFNLTTNCSKSIYEGNESTPETGAESEPKNLSLSLFKENEAGDNNSLCSNSTNENAAIAPVPMMMPQEMNKELEESDIMDDEQGEDAKVLEQCTERESDDVIHGMNTTDAI